VNGKVLVQFVVDTLGRLEPGSLKVIRTDHDGFAAAARNFVEAATFKPATKRGRKVRQLVQMPFAFSSWRPPSN
jgi:periplasmic protein TonB